MKEKLNQSKTVKRLYFTVAVAIAVVAVSAIAVSYKGNKLSDEIRTTQNSSVYEYTTKETQIMNNTEDDEETSETTKTQKEQESLITKSTEQGTEPKTEAQTTLAVIKASTDLSMPLNGKIKKDFSLTTPQYNSTMGDWRVHSGIDIEAQEGEKVLSVSEGVVSKVYVDRNWGYVIEVDHGDFLARYCSISQDDAVGIGDKVKKGSVIGTVYDIPCESEDGIHLHFETEKDGKLVNPVDIIK